MSLAQKLGVSKTLRASSKMDVSFDISVNFSGTPTQTFKETDGFPSDSGSYFNYYKIGNRTDFATYETWENVHDSGTVYEDCIRLNTDLPDLVYRGSSWSDDESTTLNWYERTQNTRGLWGITDRFNVSAFDVIPNIGLALINTEDVWPTTITADGWLTATEAAPVNATLAVDVDFPAGANGKLEFVFHTYKIPGISDVDLDDIVFRASFKRTLDIVDGKAQGNMIISGIMHPDYNPLCPLPVYLEEIKIISGPRPGYGDVITQLGLTDDDRQIWFGNTKNITGNVAADFVTTEITTAQELFDMRYAPEFDFTLMNDIDLQNFQIPSYHPASWETGFGVGQFPPIRDYYGNDKSFKGSFDGQGHRIKNLRINDPTKDYIGLFQYFSGAFSYADPDYEFTFGIKDLKVYGEIEGRNYVGGVAGGTSFSTTEKCYSNVNVTGNNYVGGLVGYPIGFVSECFSDGQVSGNDRVGGLVGENGYDVFNSYAKGSVAGSQYVGGLTGFNDYQIENCYSIGVVTGVQDVGGLVGDNYWTVIDSYWDTETSGLAESDGGTGKTTAEMFQEGTYENWDFNDVWYIGSYPKLQWMVNLTSGSISAESSLNGNVVYRLSGEINAISSISADTDLQRGLDVITVSLERIMGNVVANGSLSRIGSYSSVDVYFEYDTTGIDTPASPFVSSTTPETKTIADSFTAQIPIIDSFRDYHVRAVADTGTKKYYGKVLVSQGIETIGDRRAEAFIDGRDLETQAQRIQRGLERLAESGEEFAIDIEYLDGGPISYLEDFDIGDIVTIEYPGIVSAQVRILEARIEYTPNGKRIDFLFGRSWPDLIQVTKKQTENIYPEIRR